MWCFVGWFDGREQVLTFGWRDDYLDGPEQGLHRGWREVWRVGCLDGCDLYDGIRSFVAKKNWSNGKKMMYCDTIELFFIRIKDENLLGESLLCPTKMVLK